MSKILFLAFLMCSYLVLGQEEESETKTKIPKDKEFGIDGVVKASTIGGSYGFGFKLAFIKNENIVFGPSLRFQRVWSNFNGIRTYANIFGGGGFVHYRFKNVVFAAAELEFLKSPLNYNIYGTGSRMVPVLLIGGGISREFPVGIRINAGVYYDLINSPFSPLQFSYMSRNSAGQLQPVIYRVGFHFPF